MNDAVHEPTPEDRAITFASGMLGALGVDVFDPNFAETAGRFVRYLKEFMQPYDAAAILKAFPTETRAREQPMVVQSNIPFRAMCAHHLVPFIGRAHVGYVPTSTLVGLSKLARLVAAVSHKSPSLQEYIGEQIADDLHKHLKPRGVIVVINAEHMCMACRGVAELNVMTTTSSLRGVFEEAVVREEFFKLIDLASNHNV